jgi:hypothetical protein
MWYSNAMSFCDHCEGQRFDRSRVLRALRQMRREWRRDHGDACDAALAAALRAIRTLDVPHLELDDDDDVADQVIH